MSKARIEQRLYPYRGWILAAMGMAVLINALTLLDRAQILWAALLGQLLFGQALASYLCGWRITLGYGSVEAGEGRDVMGAFVLAGFIVMFFFRGY